MLKDELNNSLQCDKVPSTTDPTVNQGPKPKLYAH